MRKRRSVEGTLQFVYSTEEETKFKRRKIHEALLPALADLLLDLTTEPEEEPAHPEGGKAFMVKKPTTPGQDRESLAHRVRSLRSKLKTLGT